MKREFLEALYQMVTAEGKIVSILRMQNRKLVGQNLEVVPNTIRFSGLQNGAILSAQQVRPSCTP